MSDQDCIIVGAGHAAAQMVASLRQEGWGGEITLIGEEPYLPYNRPPLSKTFLSGEKNIDELLIRPAAAYEKAGVKLLLGRHVERIDRNSRELILDHGERLSYDKLALMTGGRVRQLNLPGADMDGLHYLRNADDVKGIRKEAKKGGRALIVGGGYIGLETAAMLRKMGMKVTILEADKRVLSRVTAPEVSAFFSRVHTEEGVELELDAQVEQFIGTKRIEKVLCKDGREFEADVVVAGIGIIPNTELAENAGLAVDNGIRVNAQCQTSCENIVAAGDCSRFFSEHYDQELRLESVQNAVDQAKIAAATVCGKLKAYNALPWFWSDQFDIKLQIAGLSSGYEQVVIRGELAEGRKFSAFYLRAGKLLAVDAINSPQEFMLGKRLIQSGKTVLTSDLANPEVALKSLL